MTKFESCALLFLLTLSTSFFLCCRPLPGSSKSLVVQKFEDQILQLLIREKAPKLPVLANGGRAYWSDFSQAATMNNAEKEAMLERMMKERMDFINMGYYPPNKSSSLSKDKGGNF
ncbi:hypothetical protein IE53DRAFT_362185 [Violaceomyces palustris]|uniref:Uncharacterized protein n=1 Tax=Violaceomyces palustris TaxID=1673888 RepID=A0ACD0NXV3_9BASI|nr:hypothetical protein IE53DRAFT_362185 [Violaceomyces palustris]